jgi:hypothetical protein
MKSGGKLRLIPYMGNKNVVSAYWKFPIGRNLQFFPLLTVIRQLNYMLLFCLLHFTLKARQNAEPG